MRIVVASSNRHKLQEIQTLLNLGEGLVVSLGDALPTHPPTEETGQTFEENALQKILTLPHLQNTIYLADDSGLEVTALNNRPGIYSARYGQPGDTSKDQCLRLLDELNDQTDRSARFVCVIALAFPDGHTQTVRGTIEGQIATSYEGEGGFGYDPIFIPEGYTQTYGTLPASVKAATSHRSQAMTLTKTILDGYLAQLKNTPT